MQAKLPVHSSLTQCKTETLKAEERSVCPFPGSASSVKRGAAQLGETQPSALAAQSTFTLTQQGCGDLTQDVQVKVQDVQ